MAKSGRKDNKKAEAPKKKKAAASKATKKGSNNNKTNKNNNRAPIQQLILDNANALAVQTGVSGNEGDGVDRKKVMAMCGYPTETGSCKNGLTQLRKKGHIGFDATSIWLTESGRQQAKEVDVAKSNAEQLEIAKQRVSTKGKKLLDILSDGASHSRIEVAKMLDTDPNKASWKNFLSLVKKEDCLEYCNDDPKNPALRLPDWIFPFGRPEAN